MTPQEFEQILIEGFTQTPETRIDFYLNKAKEHNINPNSFYIGLSNAYKRLDEYVNQLDYPLAWTMENGKKNYFKKSLHLAKFTSGKINGTLTHENIKDIIPFLHKIGKGLYNIELNKQEKKESKNNITGFNTTLTEPQQSKLYKALQNNYIDCTEAEFIAIFTNKPMPLNWIDTGTTRHEPNKQTIFEFFYLLKEYGYLKEPQIDLDTKPTNTNNLYRKLEFIFTDIQNFAQSSGSGKSQNNTNRKKELKTIIETL